MAADAGAHAFAYGSHVFLGRAVLAHELVHVLQQAAPFAANDSRFDHQARAPPFGTLLAAPLGVQRLGEDDDSLQPAFATDAANAVADWCPIAPGRG